MVRCVAENNQMLCVTGRRFGALSQVLQVVTVYRVRKLFRTVCPLVHCCTELRVPAIYVLRIDSGLSVWWSVEYAT